MRIQLGKDGDRMKQEMADIQRIVVGMSREKLTMLLPTHKDIRELIPALGCAETETVGDVRHAQAIHQFIADIVTTPTNHEAWRDLALAFGTNQMLRWKYLYVANCLKPNDYQILDALSFSHTMMGDTEGALDLMEKAIACAASEQEHAQGTERMAFLRFPQFVECNSSVMM